MQCWAYKIYDTLKCVTGYRHIGTVSDQKGVVSDMYGDAFDGDFTFAIEDISPQREFHRQRFVQLHCEITPCERDKLQPFVAELEQRFRKEGAHKIRIEVDGTLTWDRFHNRL